MKGSGVGGILRGGLRRRLRPGLKLLITGLGALLVVACGQQDSSADRGPVTGFSVEPQFESHYETYGSRLLGQPISGACEVAGGGTAQYFQRARLQVDPAGQEVFFYPLGEWARDGVRKEVEAPVPPDSRHRQFPETGFTVRDEFLDFYEENHGETFLGPPVSEQLDEGQLRVQYFRNGRLEWHPGAPPAERVRVGMLGQAHYLQAAHDVSCEIRARPVSASAVQDVDVLASAAAPILYTGEEQVIYALVTTPAGVPVSGVPVVLTLRDTDWTLSVELGRTDGEGKVHGALQMPRFVPGHVVGVTVEARGVDGQVIGETGLAFQTWW